MLNTKEHLEENEAKILATYALKSQDSKGRFHDEPPPEYRTQYQRDRDRILHTTAFRRLEYKTQVFVNYEGDYYRTRLTHTLEVAQIGRTIARALGVNEDLVEGICLGHDLGHSPFGHAGEHVLNHLMLHHGGFEHNRQSYRILTELERRYTRWHGLNLTYELLEGIIKHETEYDLLDVKEEGFSPELRASLEAQIANIADELAYNGHDLDDGLRSGLLVAGQLKGLTAWEQTCAGVGWNNSELNEIERHRIIRYFIGWQVTDVITQTQKNIEKAGVKTAMDIQKLEHNLVEHSEDLKLVNRQLKDFLYENLYRHYRVVRMSMKAERFITDLFNSFINEPRQLPPNTQQRISEIGLHRTVADYLAGMTDRYALQEWERLFGPFERP
ncbi:MAG: deoxyguanosinetriphosphate triphosphohydrolase [Anaerolineae bacterium]|nr:deoxyguanosinetriphosphate triphosphohydrolase [Anaerolineae bacterium]